MECNLFTYETRFWRKLSLKVCRLNFGVNENELSIFMRGRNDDFSNMTIGCFVLGEIGFENLSSMIELDSRRLKSSMLFFYNC